MKRWKEAKEIVDLLKTQKNTPRLGGKLPKGILVGWSAGEQVRRYWPPVVGEANVPFFNISVQTLENVCRCRSSKE